MRKKKRYRRKRSVFFVKLAFDTSVITGLAAVSVPAKTFTFTTVVGSDTSFRTGLRVGRGLDAIESRDGFIGDRKVALYVF